MASVQTCIVTVGGQQCLDPAEQRKNALELGTPMDFWQVASSYNCPRGFEPGVAYVLMLKVQLDKLGENSTHSVKFICDNKSLTVKNMRIHKGSCMGLRASLADNNVPYLVELRDVREVLKLSTIASAYNVRLGAPSTTSGNSLYYPESLNSGSAWTWQTMFTNIWASLPSVAGTAPTLPGTPTHAPENYQFIGVSAWKSIKRILDYLGYEIIYSPVPGTFTVVEYGDTQSGLSVSLNAILDKKIFDYHPTLGLHSSAPEKIQVFFPRQELYQGIEKDTQRTGNWLMTPYYSKTVNAISTGVAGTIMPIWDSTPALFNSSGTVTNSTNLDSRAAEIVANIAKRMTDDSHDRTRVLYGGLHTAIIPGEQISNVTWRDYRDGNGMITEYTRRPVLRGGAFSDEQTLSGDTMLPIDVSRPGKPNYPRLAQMVQADDGAATTGATLTPNGDKLTPGFVMRYVEGTWSQQEACWIRAADLVTGSSPSETNVTSMRQKDRFPARLSGIQTSSSDTRPLYIVRLGGNANDMFKVSADTGSTQNINSGDTLDFDATDVSFTGEANSTKGDRGIVQQIEVDGGDSTIKHLRTAIDKSVLQQIKLQGAFTSGTTPVLAKSGTRNDITFDSSGENPAVSIVGGTGLITWDVILGTLAKVKDDQSSPTTVDLTGPTGSADIETIQFVGTNGAKFTVSKASEVITVSMDPLPIGAVIMWYGAIETTVGDNKGKPIISTGPSVYMDDWRQMDGVENASPNPGSGMNMKNFAVCGFDGTGTPDGADKAVPAVVTAHPPHYHGMSTLTSTEGHGEGGDVTLAIDGCTTREKNSGCVSEVTLAHDFTTEGIPPTKGLHFIEKVS